MSSWPIDALRYRAHLLTALFVSLMLLLLLAPLLERQVFGIPVVSILFSLVVGAGLIVSARSRWLLWTSVCLVLPTLVALWSAPVVATSSFDAASLALRFAFLMFLSVVILNGVLRDVVVTPETIAGAASVYLLFGIACACLFGVIEEVHPGSFAIPDTWGFRSTTKPESLSPLIYFSFATLTTVGYGDIHATSPLAANLAVSEAIMGQLYLTILVARLVGLQISHSRRS